MNLIKFCSNAYIAAPYYVTRSRRDSCDISLLGLAVHLRTNQKLPVNGYDLDLDLNAKYYITLRESNEQFKLCVFLLDKRFARIILMFMSKMHRIHHWCVLESNPPFFFINKIPSKQLSSFYLKLSTICQFR